MMRSLYSGVAGLKTHQTKMDVIGNNIANVNTTAYKSSSITFSEMMNQTTQRASGPNASTGTGGTNAKQIGLGVKVGGISVAIESQGASQSTGNPFDIMINGSNFFVVNNGSSNYFTRDGSFYVDGAGNLAMTSTGYNVMGWNVDPDTGKIKQDTVSALRIMSTENMTSEPEATTKAYASGILDKNDVDVATAAGKTINLNFYDKLGYSYTAKFSIHKTQTNGQYTVQLDDIKDAKGRSITETLGISNINDIASFGNTQSFTSTELKQLANGYTYDAATKKFDHVLSAADALTDYETGKISGVSYTFPDGDYTSGSKITADGKGTVSKADLESVYGLVYYEDKSTTPSTYKYYHKDHVGGTGEDITTVANWESTLGLSGVTSAVVNADGSVTFELKQDFTVGSEDFNLSSGIFKVSLDATVNDNLLQAYGINQDADTNYTFEVAPDGQAQVTATTVTSGNVLEFNTDTGAFIGIGGGDSVTLDFSTIATDKNGAKVSLENFADLSIDFSKMSTLNNNGSSTVGATSGDEDGLGAGRMLGDMIGVSVQNNGMIYASYDNGMTKLLGQIATASFANASGLSKEGDNLYAATMNSGEFDGIGVDVSANGGYMSTGQLEMSNVDLAAEFTSMITTQRGFQANSRIITTSDSLLEELTNLKR